ARSESYREVARVAEAAVRALKAGEVLALEERRPQPKKLRRTTGSAATRRAEARPQPPSEGGGTGRMVGRRRGGGEDPRYRRDGFSGRAPRRAIDRGRPLSARHHSLPSQL